MRYPPAPVGVIRNDEEINFIPEASFQIIHSYRRYIPRVGWGHLAVVITMKDLRKENYLHDLVPNDLIIDRLKGEILIQEKVGQCGASMDSR